MIMKKRTKLYHLREYIYARAGKGITCGLVQSYGYMLHASTEFIEFCIL